MTAAAFTDTTWRIVDPEDGKKLPPLVDRIAQAANFYLKRTKQVPNIVLLRQADFAEAEREYRLPMPNGKTARIKTELSPFGGGSREILIGRRE